jgi:hypothetical protein
MERGRASSFGFADIMIVAGLVVAVLAPLILLVEGVEWLTGSEWPGLTVADGLSIFGIEHELPENEEQRLLDLLMAVPLSVALFLAGLSSLLAGINFSPRGLERDLEAQFFSDD